MSHWLFILLLWNVLLENIKTRTAFYFKRKITLLLDIAVVINCIVNNKQRTMMSWTSKTQTKIWNKGNLPNLLFYFLNWVNDSNLSHVYNNVHVYAYSIPHQNTQDPPPIFFISFCLLYNSPTMTLPYTYAHVHVHVRVRTHTHTILLHLVNL